MKIPLPSGEGMGVGRSNMRKLLPKITPPLTPPHPGSKGDPFGIEGFIWGKRDGRANPH